MSRLVVGQVVGFLLRCAGTTVWVTGDTVLYRPLRRAVRDVRARIRRLPLGVPTEL